jgi:hypothetical protein
MSLNDLTRKALDGLQDTCQKIKDKDGASPEDVDDFLTCLCFILEDKEVIKGAGKFGVWLEMALIWIRRWLRSKGG